MTLQPPITVLVIDDDEDDRFFIEQAFKRDSPNAQVYGVAGGQQALDLLDSAQPLPDVILLDLNMPIMNGFEVLAHLKQSAAYQTIPVIVLTTSDAQDDQEQARQAAATGFITKPNRLEELIEIVQWIRLTLSK